MTAGRRQTLLSLAFLILATTLTGGRVVRAQQPGQGSSRSHEIWTNNLTPEQIKAALARLGHADGDTDQFQKMIEEYLQNNNFNPQDPKVKEAIKSITGNKEWMDKLQKLAKQKQAGPGQAGKFNQEDFAKLLKDNPPKLPPDLKSLTDPKLPTNPKFPLDPKVPTDFKFPPNPKDPTPPTQGPDDPLNPMPKMLPVEPPMPMNGAITNPQPPVEDNPFGPPEEATDPRSKSLEAFAALWERNLGPLDETPEVKRALFDLVSGSGGLDFDLKDDRGNSIWDLLKKGPAGDGSAFGDLFNGGEGGSGDWNLPKFDMPSLGWGNWSGGSTGNGSSSSSSWWGGSSSGSSSPRPRPGSSSGGFGSGSGFGGGSLTPVVLFALAIFGGLLWWRFWYLRSASAHDLAYLGEGPGPWPVDPRTINTREDVVKAFEYLSVLICGLAAKTWTHSTIAEALSDLATTHGETAVMLARLYELARYAPLDEPLSRDELMEARELVCGLAGVPY